MGNVVDFNAVRSARIVRQALMQVQDAVWANFPSTSYYPYEKTIEQICQIVLSAEVQRALRSDNEPVCVAYIDTIRAIVFRRADPRTLVGALWCVLNQPVLNKVLGRRQNRPGNVPYLRPSQRDGAGAWPLEPA